MKKKFLRLIYRLPILRGIVHRLDSLETENKKTIELIKNNREKNKETFKSLRQRIKNVNLRISALAQETNAVNQKINNTNSEIDSLKKALEQANREITNLKKSNSELENELNKHKNEYANQIQRLRHEDYLIRRDTQKEIDYKYYKGLLPSQYQSNLEEWLYEKTHEVANLDNPQTYNEKIQWLKLHDNNPLKTTLSDKYLVKNYVKEKIGEEYLIPLIGVWDDVEEIPFEQLPQQFVLKANHGAGWNIIVHDKNTLDIKETKKKLNKWIKTNFAYTYGLELHYATIQPRIIAEEYIENSNGGLNDYKIFCFDGEPKYIMYLTDRSKGLKMAFYDTDWNLMPFVYNYERLETPVEKPDNLQEMLELAKKLSEGFVQIRVDFYRLDDGTLKFGELTFTSMSGACNWNPPEYNKILGDLIDLDKYKNNNNMKHI